MSFIRQLIVCIIVPAKVQNLVCTGNSADTSLTITWGEPMAQGTVVVGYSVECREVIQLPSRELDTVPLMTPFDVGVSVTRAQVTQAQGLGMNVYTCTEVVFFCISAIKLLLLP